MRSQLEAMRHYAEAICSSDLFNYEHPATTTFNPLYTIKISPIPTDVSSKVFSHRASASCDKTSPMQTAFGTLQQDKSNRFKSRGIFIKYINSSSLMT